MSNVRPQQVPQEFGSWLHRAIRGGSKLLPFERRLLQLAREHLPPAFQPALEAQLQAINLAQRQADWRGLNLYRLQWGKVVRKGLPLLPCKAGEVKLLSVRVAVPGAHHPLHVVFWAVERVFFGFATGESYKTLAAAEQLVVHEIKHSWRSNVESAA